MAAHGAFLSQATGQVPALLQGAGLGHVPEPPLPGVGLLLAQDYPLAPQGLPRRGHIFRGGFRYLRQGVL